MLSASDLFILSCRASIAAILNSILSLYTFCTFFAALAAVLDAAVCAFVFFSQCFWGLASFFKSFLKIVAKKFGRNKQKVVSLYQETE
tara:strand:+ start:70 stop:333 length:264 start_codon:yes stop_codon:yes gene_type:complete